MDRPPQQPAQAPPQQPPQTTERDMVFCHECENEWYRDEHGLTCPECQSDFTEIIEADHDPRAAAMADSDDDGPPPLGPFHRHSPWANAPDPDEDDINQLHWRQNGPNSFSVEGIIYRNVPAQRRADPHDHEAHNPIAGSFATMLQNIVGGMGAQLAHGTGNQPASEQPRGSPLPGQRSSDGFSGTLPGGGRFTYHRTTRVLGPDGTHPGAHLEPSGDDLNGLMEHLLGAIGGPPGHTHPPSGQPGQGPGQLPINPLAAIFAQLMNPGMAAPGDFVYSQEALDRIISQLMEQNATGNAPGPATREAIDALPKRTVKMEDLGPDGRAECSICMDEVTVGEEVTELPCHHWFHQQCIGVWLGEHDTCPHCRKGIMDHDKPSEGTSNASNTAATSSSSTDVPSTPSRPREQMPGAFGSGTAENPCVVPETPEQARSHAQQDQGSNTERQPSPHSVHSDENSGGLGERIRRGLFGAPR